jgi:aspartate aminotransferase
VIPISPRATRISPSQTAAFSDLAAQLRRQGRDVVSLAAGEPDFDTPPGIIEAAHKALNRGQTRYTPVRGIASLREAVRHKLHRDNGLAYEDDAVMVTAGAKQAVALAVEVLAGPGDEVLVPAPYWVSYPEMVRLAGAEPVIVPAATRDFKLKATALARAVSPRTRALILNSPCNPTGVVYRRDELLSIAEICAAGNIAVISDEIYEKIIFEGRHASIAAAHPGCREQTVVINGCSKAYAMTGWRIGYAAGPPPVIAAMAALVSQRTTCACSFSQEAAAHALENEPGEVSAMRTAYRRRRDLMGAALADAGIACPLPPATFYLLADIRHLLPRTWRRMRIETTQQFALLLLRNAGVAVVPGEPFGAPGHIRLSFATSRSRIEVAMDRMAAFIRQLGD